MGNLTAVAVKAAKATEKAYKLTDGDGLYLYVALSGKRTWRYDYRFIGKRKTLTIGAYPDISLSDARLRHFEARKRLADGIDPALEKQIKKQQRIDEAADCFESIAREWFSYKISDKSKSYRDRTLRILEKDLFPALARRPISAITAQEMLFVLRKIEVRSVDMAHRSKQTAGQIFRYAIATGRANSDPSRDLVGVLRSVKKNHYATITSPSKIGRLLRDIDQFEGTFVVKTALQISPLLFQRPGEIRQMEWSEINWQEQRWEIPAEKMKMRNDHIVPLSRQSIELLEAIEPLSGRFKYVFPSARGRTRCMSENAVRTALRDIGYTNQDITPHGFRAMARTLLDEQLNFRVDYIEHQIAHAVKDPTGRAYNRTSHIEARTQMMQVWADYLDSLKEL